MQAAGKQRWQQAGPALVAIVWRGLAEPRHLATPEDRKLWLCAIEAIATVGPVWTPQFEKLVGPVPPASLYAPALVAMRNGGVADLFAALWRSPLPDELRQHTVIPFARLRGASGAERLMELLESPVLQGPAIQALAEMGAVDALVAGLGNRSAAVRSASAAALGAVGKPRAASALQPLLRDADAFVRCEAAWALAAITQQPVVYTDHLGEARQATP